MILALDTTAFRDAEQLLDRVSLPTTLPEMVFPSELRDYCWLEFEDMLGDEFWACLQQCALEAGDSHVLVRCRSPYPFENFGFAGIAKFDVSATPNEYSDFLDTALPESLEISPRNVGQDFQIAGAGGRWAFHGDRSVELLVGAHASGLHWPVVRGVRYHTFETMLDLASAPYRRIPHPGYSTPTRRVTEAGAGPSKRLWRAYDVRCPRHCPQCGRGVPAGTSTRRIEPVLLDRKRSPNR